MRYQLRWKDVINKIESANLDQQHQAQTRQYLRVKKYLADVNQQISKHHSQMHRINHQKAKQRLAIEQAIEEEKIHQLATKQTKMRIEQQYRQENRTLSKAKSNKLHPIIQQPMDPFHRLIQAQQQRKQQQRVKWLLQNQVNNLQSKIKHSQRLKHKDEQYQQKIMFDNFVQALYQKHIARRNQYKRRYLSIGQLNCNKTPRLSQSTIQQYPQYADKEYSQEIEKQYKQYCESQIKDKHEKNRQEELLDQRLSKINIKLDVSDSSPAYLGRNVLSYDRRKQLAYIDKQLGLNRSQTYASEKPRPSLNSVNPQNPQNRVNIAKQVKQFPLLLKYYKNNLKTSFQTKTKTIDISLPTIPSNTHNPRPTNTPNPNNFINHSHHNPSTLHRRMKTQPQPSNRSFITYNVITGSRKLLHI